MSTVGLSFREGTASDLGATFALAERTRHDAAARQGIVSDGPEPTPVAVRGDWQRERSLIEFMAAQPDGRYVICEAAGEPIAYARVVRFGGMEQLTELRVDREHQGRGIGRDLLERCWPGDPSADHGRVVIASGAPADVSLFTDFGVMPITGHWHMRQRTEAYLEARAAELESFDAGAVHVLAAENAVAEWKRLEPNAIGHPRPRLHEFFGRDRTCLARVDDATGVATALCWVSSDGEIGPAVGAWPKDLVPVVLAALDRVAKTQAPDTLDIYSTTISWWLLHRLRGLGFHVHWPGWILCSVPLPGLDRYVPTRPSHLL